MNIFDGNAETVSQRLEIHCPSAAGFPSLVMPSRPRWCNIIPITRAEDELAASRSEAVWYYDLAVSSEGLPTSHEAHAVLCFGFSGDDSYQVKVPIAVALGKRVATTPSQVYIGRRHTLDPISKVFVLTINDPTLAPESISLAPSSGILGVTTVATELLEGPRLKVTVLVTPRRREPVRGNILVRTSKGETVGAVPVFGLIDVDSPTVFPSGA
ncbi:MAG: hypothetical protein M3552_01130 [Planctomycetota bacterium]|nr:hypothetical protein [Planctomycetota bacterium]